MTVPSEIENLVNGSAFKLDGLGAGLEDYLFYLEAALRTGSGDGKLPVIGKDLQAGADFLGGTRHAINTAFDGAGIPSTAGEVEDFLVDELEGVLPGVATGEVVPALTCNATLGPVDQPSSSQVGPDPTDTLQTYWYAVVAAAEGRRRDRHRALEAVSVENSDALSPAGDIRTNTVTWEALDGASGYKVIRSLTDPAGGLNWQEIADLGAGVTSYTDDGTATATGYVPATEEAPVDGCPDGTPATQIDGVSLTLSLGQGTPDEAQGCTGPGCLSASLPVDLGLPGLSLKTPGGAMTGTVGWALDLTVVLDRTDGFYVDTSQDGEFRIGAGLGLDSVGGGPDLVAQLAIIDVTVEKNDPAKELRGMFSIDLNGLDDDKLHPVRDRLLGCAGRGRGHGFGDRRHRLGSAGHGVVGSPRNLRHFHARVGLGQRRRHRRRWVGGGLQRRHDRRRRLPRQGDQALPAAGARRDQADGADPRHHLHPDPGDQRPVGRCWGRRGHDRHAGRDVQHPRRRPEDRALPRRGQAGQGSW